MIIGTVAIHIHLHGIGSLKDKRRIVKSLVERLKSRFNFSVAEVAAQNSKIRAVIGIATVANDATFVNRAIDKVIEFVRRDGRFYMGNVNREIFSSEE